MFEMHFPQFYEADIHYPHFTGKEYKAQESQINFRGHC